MRLRGLPVLLVAALLSAPLAVAGTARDPEIQDERDPRPPHLDVTEAWLVAEDAGIRFFVRAAEPARIDTVYYFLFHVQATDANVGGAVGYGNDGILRGHLLHDGTLRDLSSRIRPGFEGIANGQLSGLDRDGDTMSAVIPWGAAPGLEEGAELHGLSAGTLTFVRGRSGWQPGDSASTDEVVVASIPPALTRYSAGVLPILVPAWALPLIVVGATLAGAATGLAWAGARAKEAPASHAASARPGGSAPPRPPLPPPGQRFRAAPPRR